MRKIRHSSQFKRDYKREQKGQYREVLTRELPAVLESLALDEPLAQKYKDHPLIGKWSPSHDCHIRPDLVLVYQKQNDDILYLVRLGSHSELDI